MTLSRLGRAATLVVALGCGADGKDGADGQPGQEGRDGKDGQGVTVAELDIGDRDCPRGGVRVTSGDEEHVVCNGDPGEEGAQGIAGAFRPVIHATCSVALDIVDAQQSLSSPSSIGQDGVFETGLDYDLIVYSTGDVEVSCQVAKGSVDTAAHADFFPSVTNGAVAKSCRVASDYPPFPASASTVGQWAFSVDGTGPTAGYEDSDQGHPLNGDFYAFTDDDCFVRRIDGNGTWVQGTISDFL